MAATPSDTAFLTTKEVATLLRVRERKVYDMAAAGEIPHRRITGKLLFPKSDIDLWLDGGQIAAERPAILAGSHDPLLDWAVREAGTGLATLFDGSGSGLDCFTRGEAALCGLHIPDEDGWNVATLAKGSLKDAVLIGWATRRQGLIVAPENEKTFRRIEDLSGARFALRQPGAGARALFDRLAEAAGLTDAVFSDPPARTETDAAMMVANGEADAALGLQAAARQYRLSFVPLIEERFDLLIDRRSYFLPPVQALLRFAATDIFTAKAKALGGYDIAGLGEVRWVSA
ncbi:helix-turn-helix transcriptional regulator [Thalassococcus sp. S3]|uniref:helix-turn-helix transcriptional regulator n=1 Tax=Thalassococcus sp. S3 TaxID=2017482 RepID=UPI0010248609|nr:helix-turn-helix transcriptional regulator [Thalassococcus sp. S3]QBF32413.1 excisionase [Thalassococcus sp. S3]